MEYEEREIKFPEPSVLAKELLRKLKEIDDDIMKSFGVPEEMLGKQETSFPPKERVRGVIRKMKDLT